MGFNFDLGSAIGSVVGGFLGYKGADDTNELNYKMFHEQLEYDKPINQVARLKEAGLNPNLVYGSGIQNMQTAGKQPKFENPMEKALSGLNLGLLKSQLQKANAEAQESKANAEIAKSNAQYTPVANTFAMLQSYENYFRMILNNERLRFDNSLLFQGKSPSFDRGPIAQGGRLLMNFLDYLQGKFSDGVTSTSRPNFGNGNKGTPSEGQFLRAMSNPGFVPAGSWAYGSSYR